MTTQVIGRGRATDLPGWAVAIREGGLLAGVRRPCCAHDEDCACVGRTGDGHLVFWCPAGEHHFTAA
jgi:hypothetical protein